MSSRRMPSRRIPARRVRWPRDRTRGDRSPSCGGRHEDPAREAAGRPDARTATRRTARPPSRRAGTIASPACPGTRRAAIRRAPPSRASRWRVRRRARRALPCRQRGARYDRGPCAERNAGGNGDISPSRRGKAPSRASVGSEEAPCAATSAASPHSCTDRPSSTSGRSSNIACRPVSNRSPPRHRVGRATSSGASLPSRCRSCPCGDEAHESVARAVIIAAVSTIAAPLVVDLVLFAVYAASYEGSCGPHPTDIPAHPCPYGDYLGRVRRVRVSRRAAGRDRRSSGSSRSGNR